MEILDIYLDLYSKYRLEYQFISDEFNTDNVPFGENKLLMSIDKAYKAICKYLDYTGAKSDEYVLPTIFLSKAYFNNDAINNKLLQGKRDITQMAQGSRSVTYGSSSFSFDSNGLTDDVKSMLPLPEVEGVMMADFFYDKEIGVLKEAEGYLYRGSWVDGELSVIKTISCDVQPSNRELIFKEYGYYIDCTKRVFCDIDTDILEGGFAEYKGVRFQITKVIEWDDYLDIFMKEV